MKQISDLLMLATTLVAASCIICCLLYNDADYNGQDFSRFPRVTSTDKPKQLVHVFNLYHADDDDIFSPLNYEQWIMLNSVTGSQQVFHDKVAIKRSQDRDNAGRSLAFESVKIVCAVMDHDMEALDEVLSKYCDQVSILTRSTATEYHQIGCKSLPFVQDIINAGISTIVDDEQEYYLMYTNSDISTTEGFYSYVERLLKTDDLMGMTINRITLPDHFSKITEIQQEGSDQAVTSNSSFADKDSVARNIVKQARNAVESGAGWSHVGMDCFVYHSSIVKAFNFGDLFIGYSPFDTVMRGSMRIMLGESQAPAVESSKLGTFHIGKSGAWNVHPNEEEEDAVVASWEEANPGQEDQLKMVELCYQAQYRKTSLYSLQNHINCGKVFAPRRNDAVESEEEIEEGRSLVPAFVPAGYEELYLKTHGLGTRADELKRVIEGKWLDFSIKRKS